MNAPAKFEALYERRLRRSKALLALCDEADEILRRTGAIVDRLLPPLPMPQFSFSGYDGGSGIDYVIRHGDHCRARQRLHSEIRPRIAAKVRGRSA